MPGQCIGAKTLKLCKGAQGKSVMNTEGRLKQFYLLENVSPKCGSAILPLRQNTF